MMSRRPSRPARMRSASSAIAGSPRYRAGGRARGTRPAAYLPYVTPVLLFVNAQPRTSRRRSAAVPNAMLQFHGDESPAGMCRFSRPYVKAFGMSAARRFVRLRDAFRLRGRRCLPTRRRQAMAAAVASFDWSAIPARGNDTGRSCSPAGSTPHNVGDCGPHGAPLCSRCQQRCRESPRREERRQDRPIHRRGPCRGCRALS